MMKIDESKTIVDNYLKNNRNTMDNITIKAFNHLFDFYGIQITTKPNRNTNKINYPENIIATAEIYMGSPLSDDQVKGLEHVIETTLTEREGKVLYFRFHDGMTLEETGKRLGLTRERIRQIETRTLRKLKNPIRLNVIKEGYETTRTHNDTVSKYKDEITRLNKLIDDVKSKQELLEKVLTGSADDNEIKETGKIIKNAPVVPELDINYLDLSVRSYNCLVRAGFKTVSQLSKLRYSDLMKVRNLGLRCTNEIAEKLKPLGIELENDLK